MQGCSSTLSNTLFLVAVMQCENKILLTRSFCLSGGDREATGSRTSHFSVTGWTSTPVKGSLIFTLTSNLPPVGLRPSITYQTSIHSKTNVVCTGTECGFILLTLTSMISLTLQWFSRASSFRWAVPMTLSVLNRPLQSQGEKHKNSDVYIFVKKIVAQPKAENVFTPYAELQTWCLWTGRLVWSLCVHGWCWVWTAL